MKINFGGKERGFQWGMGCLEKYCDLMDCDMEGLILFTYNNKAQIKAATSLLLAGMLNYSEINDEAIDYNYSKVQLWLDEAPQDTWTAIVNDFVKSKYLGKTIEDYFAVGSDDNDASVKKK